MLEHYPMMSIDDESYVPIKDIDDSGVFSLVTEVIGKSSNKKFAIKQYKDTYDECPFVFELECFALNCPYIIRGKNLLETFTIDDDPQETIGVVLDIAEGDGVWLVNNSDIDMDMKKRMFAQAVIAIHYLHECRVLHLDVKPSNFLVFKEKSGYKMMLTDFSLSIQIPRDSEVAPFDIDRINVAVRPPEYNCKGYNMKHDVWALGLSLLFMSVNSTAYRKKYRGKLEEGILDKIVNKLFKMNTDTDFIDLIKCMLNRDPKKRYSMSDVIQHRFIQREIKENEFQVSYPTTTYRKVEKTSHITMKEFHLWCVTKDVSSNISTLAGIILHKNNSLLENVFMNQYDNKFKVMIKWAISLSISRELIQNNSDSAEFIDKLFMNECDVGSFSKLILEMKLMFIAEKYQLVYEGKEKGLMYLDH